MFSLSDRGLVMAKQLSLDMKAVNGSNGPILVLMRRCVIQATGKMQTCGCHNSDSYPLDEIRKSV